MGRSDGVERGKEKKGQRLSQRVGGSYCGRGIYLFRSITIYPLWLLKQT